jgi:hypothetical protein
VGVQPGSSTKFWEVICFNWKILKAIELSPKIFGIFWDVWYETTWFIFFCIEPTQLNQDTVYGKRDGAVTGLALIYNQKGNLFKQTPGWKTGVVHNVSMLQRNEMWKPPCVFWLSIMAFLLIHVRVGPQLLKHFSGRPSHQNTLNISRVPPASIGFPRQAQPRASFLTWAELSRTSRKWSKSLGIGGWFCPTKSQLQTQGCLETIPGWWLD